MELHECPPSVMDPVPSLKLSKKYGFFNTSELVTTFFNHGFSLVSAQARRTKKKDPRTTKHLLRFRVKGQDPIHGVHPEVVVRNSHDGTCSASFFAGIFRMVCINGCIICDAIFAPSIVIRHTVMNESKIRESMDSMMQTALRVTHYIPQLAEVQMSPAMLDSYAQRASEFLPSPIIANQLLSIRREEDKLPNLWIVYNRVQENLIRGGMRTTHVGRRISNTREIVNIERKVDINSKLWQLTLDMAKNHQTYG